jgi:2,4-dienoyl-CoA reductase-like NADH-dependent reductase (Old Yellow Enzyme family)
MAHIHPAGDDMTAPLFTPCKLGPIELPNRIVVAPMCQYSADDGCMSDWHMQHLMTLAMSGAGLVVVEATAVERLGRITHGCVGLYSDANERAMKRILDAARAVAPKGTKFGVQIAHAGRKASAKKPWDGLTGLEAGEDPWETFAPSALSLGAGWPTPTALDAAGCARIRDAFAAAAARAVRIGFDEIELHLSHGYLLHSFQSPLTNTRTDGYGGDRIRRMAFPVEVAEAVRAAVPAHVALGARISGSDWMEGGLGVDDAVDMARALKAADYHFVCVSSGGLDLGQKIALSPGYQVEFAAKVRAAAGISTRAVGLIVDPGHANAIIANGEADMVALARGFLDDPRWPWRAAEALGAEIARPVQYARAAPRIWPGAAQRPARFAAE